VNYHCPTCTRKPHVRAKCRLEAEIKAKREAELRAIAKLEKDKEERGQADEVAGAMFEFFAGVYDEGPRHELPIPSPDSITVTTEFGVYQEPANVTMVSASGPSGWYYQSDEGNEVEMTEHLLVEVEQELAQMHIPVSTHVQGMFAHILDLPVEVEPEHVLDEEDEIEDELVNDTGEEADIDTDDLDIGAESALDDGVLTPTTTVAGVINEV
jgi:hypothetical protein